MEEQFDPSYILELAHKIKAGNITDQELAEYNKWYSSVNKDVLELPEGYASNPLVIRDRMHDNLLAQLNAENPVKTFRISGIWWKSAAAAVLLVGGLFFFMNRDRSGTVKPDVAVVQEDIAPGRQSATLTLADGKKIVLSDAANGKLIEEAGVSITKAADGQLVYELKDKGQGAQNKINTLSTAKGETYRLRLPDGSLVWLNAASSLTYAFSLNERGERRVKLSGEAYFEIAKDKAHPFVVSTDRQEVEVLGTHFNISAYRDESSIRTTLLEGRVRVISPESLPNGSEKILEPNQQAINIGNVIQVVKVNAEYEVAWKNGYFMFNDEPLENILLEVSRWYNVQISYDLPEIRKMRFYGTVSRFENVSKVLEKLELTDKVKFEIKDKQIKVFRKNP